MMNFGKYAKVVMLIVTVYVYIFNPLVKGLPNLIWLFLPIAGGYILYHSLTGKLLYLFKNEMILVVLITLFTLLRDVDWTNGTLNKNFLYVNGSLLVEAFPLSFFIVDVCSKKFEFSSKDSDNRLINVILWTCAIAAFITIILLVNPGLNNLMNNKILAASEYQQNNLLRGFGFASTLFYSYGLVQGTAAAIILLKMSEDKKHFFVYFIVLIVLLISILVNARIGMAPVIIMICYLIFVRKKIKMFLYASGILGVLLVVFLSSDFAEKYQKIIEWGFSFFTQTLGFVSEGKHQAGSNTYSALGKMVVLPDNIFDWIIGSGTDLFLHGQTSGTITHSDVGFVRQLYYGGIVYLTLLMTLVTVMAVRLYNLRKHRWFFILFVLTVIAANIKSNFINNHSAFRLFLLIYMGFIYYAFQDKQKKMLTKELA